MRKVVVFIGFVIFMYPGFSQKFDKSMFKEFQPGFYENSILKDNREVDEKLEEKPVVIKFFMDQSGLDLPNKVNLYKREWATPVISQGNGGTCWSFSTTSYMESEVYRLYGKKVKISEIYTVYWEYVEKARGFVRERGNSLFDDGSEANALTRIYSMYGAEPQSAYTGLTNGRKFHTHEAMLDEMGAFLKSVKESNTWNEQFVIETIKNIMDHHIGKPPAEFEVEGEKYTPKTYLKDYLKLNPGDYIEILSYKQEPYWKQVEYKVPDNWWHSKEYYNVPLDVFMDIIKKSIREGFTMGIGGDISEAGLSKTTNVALVPTFDIPSEYINEDARQFRFSNESTTDDHGMHLVGYYEKDGKDWYLIKDSSSGSRNIDSNSPEFGYYFFHEDYVKLKMMGFTIHKDAIKNILKKFE